MPEVPKDSSWNLEGTADDKAPPRWNLDDIPDDIDLERPPATPGRIAGAFFEEVRTFPSQQATTYRTYTEQMVDPQAYAELQDAWGILSPVEQAEVSARAYAIAEEENIDFDLARDKALQEHWTTYKEEAIESFREIEESRLFKPSEEYQGSSSGFLEDVARGVGTSLPNVVLGLLTPAAMFPSIYGHIHGRKYQELMRRPGMTPERAFRAAQMSAFAQTPLELAGSLLQLKAIMGRGPWIERLRQVAVAALGEGAEEFAQQYPDEFATIWALNPNLSPEELHEHFRSKLGEITRDAAYAGLVGATAGAILPSMGIATEAGLDRLISDKQRRINEEKKQVRERVLAGAEEAPAAEPEISKEEFIQQVRSQGSDIQVAQAIPVEGMEEPTIVTKEAGQALTDVERDMTVYEDLIRCLSGA